MGTMICAVSAFRDDLIGHDLESLASTLGARAHGAQVDAADIRWLNSEGLVADAVIGRRVLFLARSPTDATRDVWQARALVSPEGSVFAVRDAYNLTSTPLGDDHELVVLGDHAAFSTAAYGREQSISILYLAGEGAQNRSERFADRAMAAITNLQQTGSVEGVGRGDITLESPAWASSLRIDNAFLDIALFDSPPSTTPSRSGRFDLSRGQLAPLLPGAHASASLHLTKLFPHWVVDTLRAVPWIGPAPIAWIEDQVLSLRDTYRRFAFRPGNRGTDVIATPKIERHDAPAIPMAVVSSWPPAQIPTIWNSAEEGEGVWREPEIAWLRRTPGLATNAPSPFYVTFLRPDDKRPYVRVSLVAMNMYQLDLDMEAGVEDPEPMTGPHGTGRIPRDPAVFRRVAATFNGAFKTDHGHYGMMVHRRVLLPAIPDSATVAVLDDGRVAFGTWGADPRRSGFGPDVDRAMVSFRQNLDPLVDQGIINPTGRNLWGFTLPGKSVQTERSGLCVTKQGHLIYAWGDDLSANTLAVAMRMSDCNYAMHLDMNPYHTGFMFTSIDDFATKSYHSELLSPAMSIPVDRYIHYSPKDFFYVMVHDPTPPAVDGATPWENDGGRQPPPSWMPGVWSSHTETHSGRIELEDIEPKRTGFRIRAGLKDATAAFALRSLDASDADRALLAVGAGFAPERHPRAIATDGNLAVPPPADSDWGELVASPDETLSIVPARSRPQLVANEDMIELPLILWDGTPSSKSTSDPSKLRAALGITAGGRVVFARGQGADLDLADALARAGCDRAVALDRGAETSNRWERRDVAGGALRTQSDESTIWVLASSIAPRGVRLDSMHSASDAKPHP